VTARFDDVEPLRHRIMSAVGQHGTTLEKLVRRPLHEMNYCYRLHRKDLPGRQDIVFGGRRKSVFVLGCFWDRYLGCSKAPSRKTRADFRALNFDRNVEHDQLVERRLGDMGWQILVVLDYEMRMPDTLLLKLRVFLENSAGARIAA